MGEYHMNKQKVLAEWWLRDLSRGGFGVSRGGAPMGQHQLAPFQMLYFKSFQDISKYYTNI